MTDVNHLGLAKDYVAKLLEHEDGSVPPELAKSAGMFIAANALIAIAEQLERICTSSDCDHRWIVESALEPRTEYCSKCGIWRKEEK